MSWHNDNPGCHQRQPSRQIDDPSSSMVMHEQDYIDHPNFVIDCHVFCEKTCNNNWQLSLTDGHVSACWHQKNPTMAIEQIRRKKINFVFVVQPCPSRPYIYSHTVTDISLVYLLWYIDIVSIGVINNLWTMWTMQCILWYTWAIIPWQQTHLKQDGLINRRNLWIITL